MADPQGICTFPGINRILTATYTLSHGISPGACNVTADIQPNLPSAQGTLRFLYGRTVITFPDSRIDYATVRRNRAAQRVIFQILDRRWKWQPKSGGGTITGKWNERRKDGTIIPDSEKTPQDLAKLLLREMNESGVDVSDLPNRSRPPIVWVYSHAPSELAALCDSLGCRVVLGLDNRIRLKRVGFGRPLPTTNAMTASLGFNPADRPSKLIIAGGPTLYQSKLKLEAVGEETNGDIKPIDDLSYTPSEGWETEYPGNHFNVAEDEGKRQLAKKTVYRWYRIVSQADGTQNVPGLVAGKVTKISQLLPLQNRLATTIKDSDGVDQRQPAYVEGVFYDNVSTLPSFENTEKGTKYPGSFTINTEKGIVEFAGPVFEWTTDPVNFFPAELYLNCSYHVTDPDNRQKIRETHEINVPRAVRGTSPRVIRRDDLVFTSVAIYEDHVSRAMRIAAFGLGVGGVGANPDPTKIAKIANNATKWQQEANHALRNALLEYQEVASADVEVIGIVRVEPDGAIQQVTWQVGGGPAMTAASRNNESNLTIPQYSKRRGNERMKLMLGIDLGKILGLTIPGDADV